VAAGVPLGAGRRQFTQVRSGAEAYPVSSLRAGVV